MNRCKTCKWWAQTWTDGTPYSESAAHRMCLHPKVDAPIVRSEDSLNSQADHVSFVTSGPEFGCVHWDAKI